MSEIENPFNIDSKRGRNSPKRIRYSNVWTRPEQNDKLIGYLEISPDLWTSIKCGSHIRYVTKDNQFRTGGFILKNPFIFKGETNIMKPSVEIGDNNLENGEKMGIRLQNYFNTKSPDYTTWIVAYDDIMKLYLKVDASIRTIVNSLENTIENININMKKITDYIKKMDDRIKKIETKNRS
jgi:hypothetical protein